MNCKQARLWLSPYLDSELGQTKTFEVSEHLRVCPECQTRFERERQADDLIRARLEREAMPDGLWAELRKKCHARAWTTSVWRGRNFALAACLAMVVVGTAVFWPKTGPVARPWFASQLAAAAPDNRAFLRTGPEADVLDAIAARLGTRIGMRPTGPESGHVGLELISAARRADQAGREYVEVRLNCCGQPVLLALARPRASELPAPFEGIALAGAKSAQSFDGVNLAAADLGGVMAVAVSRHPVRHIVDGLRVSET